MRVHYRYNYLRAAEHKPSEAWWAAFFIVRAVKYGQLKANNSFTVRYTNGTVKTYTKDDAHLFRPKFGAFIKKLLLENFKDPVSVVGIPSKDALVGATGSFRSSEMLADALRDHCDVGVIDALRWREVMTRASEGGPRDARILYNNMKVIKKGKRRKVVVVDDLITSDSHMRAATQRLREAEYDVVCGIACGRTVSGTTGLSPYEPGYIDIDESLGFREDNPEDFNFEL